MKRQLALLGVALLVSAGTAAAQANFTWDGGGADTNWTTPENWVADSSYPGAVAGDAAYFNDSATGAQTINLDQDISIDAWYSLVMEDTAGGDYTITTGTGASEQTFSVGYNMFNYSTAYDLIIDAPFERTADGSIYLRPQADTTIVFNRSYRAGQTGQSRIRGAGTLVFNADTDYSYGLYGGYAEGSGGTVVLGSQNALPSLSFYNVVETYNVELTTDAELTGWQNMSISGGGDPLASTVNVRVREGDTDRTLTLLNNNVLGTTDPADKFVLDAAGGGGAGAITMKTLYDGITFGKGNIEIKSGQRLLIDTPAEGAGNQFRLWQTITGDPDGLIEVMPKSQFLFYDVSGDEYTAEIDDVMLQLNASGEDQAVLNMYDFGAGPHNEAIGGLSGGGRVALESATITIEGTLSPGMSAGTLTVSEGTDDTGSIVLGSSSESLFELDTPTGTNDQVVMTDADLVLDGTLVVEDLGGMAVGDVFTLFGLTDGTATGAFAAVNNRTRYFGAVSVGDAGGDGQVNDVLLTLTGEAIMGDVNKDGKVDGLDLTALAGSWDANDAQWVDGDLTGDGNVDGLDLTALAGNWDAVANGPIPEPATLALLSLGGAALLRRRRRS